MNPDMEQDKELGNLLMSAGDNEETDYEINRRDDYNEEKDYTPGVTLYRPGTIAPKDLYFSDKHGKLVAMDDVDDKYHDRLELVYRKGDKIEGPMDEDKGMEISKKNYADHFKTTGMKKTKKINEGRGDMDIIKGIIRDRANESGFEEKIREKFSEKKKRPFSA